MKLKGLKPGTLLVWDAPEPYQGYSKNIKGCLVKEGRVYYTCVVTDRKSSNPLHEAHIQTIGNTFHWMGGESEYLRLPTEDELKILEFPKMKNYDD